MTLEEKEIRAKTDYDVVFDAGIRKIIEKPITDLKIPEGTQSIRPYCFYKCEGLDSIYLPPTMQTVNESAFEACNGITSLIIPSGLSIGKNAFANMASLKTVHFGGNATIHPLAFIGSSVTDIYVPWNEGEDHGATVLSYQMSFKKVEGVALPNIIEMALPFKSSNYSLNRIFGIDNTGAITLQNGTLTQGESTLIGTVTEDAFTTVRLTVDLVTGLITAYDDNLDIIAQIKTTDANFPYYDQPLRAYHLWLSAGQAGTATASDPDEAFLFDDLIIANGNIFEEPQIGSTINSIHYETNGGTLPEDAPAKYDPAANDIIYNAGVGTLPEDAPVEYDPSVDTELPTLAKDGYIFKGWYTTATFEAGTRVEKIAAGTYGPVTLYAKWNYVVLSEDYSESVINTTGEVTVNDIQYKENQGAVTLKTEDGSLRVDLSFNAKRAKTTWMVKTLGAANGVPWGAYDATIHYDYDTSGFYE